MITIIQKKKKKMKKQKNENIVKFYFPQILRKT